MTLDKEANPKNNERKILSLERTLLNASFVQSSFALPAMTRVTVVKYSSHLARKRVS
jgi:hypothetical protein